MFVRVVPDDSVKFGFKIIDISDYKKYKQGYCLAENRILPKEELYKRAILDYLDKSITLAKMLNKKSCEVYDYNYAYCDYNPKTEVFSEAMKL